MWGRITQMWARIAEQLLGVWLALFPFLLAGGATPTRWGDVHDLACGAAIVVISGLCWLPACRRLHLVLLPLSLWLFAYGWWGVPAGAVHIDAAQNRAVVGLTLAMLAIVPTHASDPPESVREQDFGTESGTS